MKKLIYAISALFLLVIASFSFTACAQEPEEYRKTLYYGVGDTYEIKDDKIVLTFDYANGKKTITIPAYTYYDCAAQYGSADRMYYGATGVDEVYDGIMFLKYVKEARLIDLGYQRIEDYAGENVLEVWHYEAQKNRVYAVLMIADDSMHTYIMSKVRDDVSSEVKAETEFKQRITGMFSGEDIRIYLHDGTLAQEGC